MLHSISTELDVDAAYFIDAIKVRDHSEGEYWIHASMQPRSETTVKVNVGFIH